MMRSLVSAIGLFVFSFLLSLQARSQGAVQFRTPGNDSIKVVEILNTESYRFEKKSDSVELTFLVGNVRIKQEKTLIYCDSLVMNPHENYVECFGHAHINDNDSVNIYSDYLKYQVDQKMVHFQKNVKLTDGKGELTTDELQYDLARKVGTYDHGGKIVNKESVLTSDKAVYFEDTKDVHFKEHVVLRDPQYDLSADSLLYNTQTQVSTFITETFIQFKDSTHRTVRTREGFYDLKNKKAQFGRRPIITDGSKRITGDEVKMDDSTGISTARGNAIFSDTAEGVTLRGGYMINNKKKNTFLATERPLMALKQDKDSLYVTADTLTSGRLIDFEGDQRRIAHNDSLHRVYIDSLEKVQADSLHRLTIARRAADSAQAIKDSIENLNFKDKSDSLGAGVADSLGKIALDSLHKARGDTGIINNHHQTDSLHKNKTDSVPRTLTPKELKLKEQARLKAIKDSIDDAKYEIKLKKRLLADSLKTAARDEKERQRDRADSIKRQASIDNYKARMRAADSLRRVHFIDSLKKTGLSDSAVAEVLDSVGRKRRADSIANIQRLKGLPPLDTALKKIPLSHEDSLALLPTTDTTLRYIVGYHHVRIFSDSLQAVSDSLYYSTKDSTFRLFYNPVAWGSGGYQVTGDTMYVYTKNKKASRLYVFENALTINKINSTFYNQLKGTTINCYFKEGELDFIRAKGNSESIYYLKDESNAYSGVNKAHADIIDMIFAPKLDSAGKPELDSAGKSKGKELNRVVLRNDAEGSLIPIRQVNFDDMHLRGFKWQEQRRPKSKQELFEAIKKPKSEEDDEPPVIEQTTTPRGGMPKVIAKPKKP
ncbi:MAG: hypothetical protein JST68_19990 [Bacteroidetes bacterium]|nr:hypothetical protein [Bacteroidota bacterium]